MFENYLKNHSFKLDTNHGLMLVCDYDLHRKRKIYDPRRGITFGYK